jgi:hypothetical protein
MRLRPFRLLVTIVPVCALMAAVGIAAPQSTPASSAPPDPRSPAAQTTPAPRPNDAVPGLAAFETRVKDYMTLHKKLEDALPKLPKEASPQQIDRNQRTLGAQIKAARPNARAGEVFVPEIQGYVRRVLANIFQGAQGKALRGSIMDENPSVPAVRVNERYPDTVPLSTMPPEVLAVLPKLPEGLEYRFVGDALILLDGPAHIIVDFVPRALPNA